MKHIICIIIGAFIVNVLAYAELEQHDWTAKLIVVDDSGQPIANARVRVYYGPTNNISGVSDAAGVFVASHHDAVENLAFEADKAGYYHSRVHYHKGYKYDDARWHPVKTMILRRIGQPVPMYARRARLEIPEIGKPIGFDLIEGDWIEPYGKGKQSDFVFQAERRWESRNNFDVAINLTFKTPEDGLLSVSASPDQGSELRLSAVAPMDGYVGELSRHFSHGHGEGWKRDEIKDANYYFRIRTVLDDQHHIKSALYGKVYGDFAIDPINSKTLTILFTYYLNPESNSRNVEFDPKEDLFKNLSVLERVKDP